MKKNNSVNPRLAMKRICSVTVLLFGFFFLESGKASDCPKQILELPLPNFEYKDGVGDRSIFQYSGTTDRKYFWAELWKLVKIANVTLEKVVAKKDSVLSLLFHTGEEYQAHTLQLKKGTYTKLSFGYSSPILNNKRAQDLAVGLSSGEADIFGVVLSLDISELSPRNCSN
jgi:hypothetical protein